MTKLKNIVKKCWTWVQQQRYGAIVPDGSITVDLVIAGQRVLHEGQLAIPSEISEIPQPKTTIYSGEQIQVSLTNHWTLPVRISCGMIVEFGSGFQQNYALGFTTSLPNTTVKLKNHVSLDCRPIKLIVAISKRSVKTDPRYQYFTE